MLESPLLSPQASRLPVRRGALAAVMAAATAAFRLPLPLLSPRKSSAIGSSLRAQSGPLARPAAGALSPKTTVPERATPEKVLQELKAAAAAKMQQLRAEALLGRKRQYRAVDDEVSLAVGADGVDPVGSMDGVGIVGTVGSMGAVGAVGTVGTVGSVGTVGTADTVDMDRQPPGQTAQTMRRRMSLRNAANWAMGDEDPLEWARTTLHNTKANSGYRTCRLVYRRDTVERPRPASPVHRFSDKDAPMHMDTCSDDLDNGADASTDTGKRRLRFNRQLQYWPELDASGQHDPELEVSVPLKPCLRRGAPPGTDTPRARGHKTSVEVLRFAHAGAAPPAEKPVGRPRTALSGARRTVSRGARVDTGE